jgi:hypothetical protein
MKESNESLLKQDNSNWNDIPFQVMEIVLHQLLRKHYASRIKKETREIKTSIRRQKDARFTKLFPFHFIVIV